MKRATGACPWHVARKNTLRRDGLASFFWKCQMPKRKCQMAACCSYKIDFSPQLTFGFRSLALAHPVTGTHGSVERRPNAVALSRPVGTLDFSSGFVSRRHLNTAVRTTEPLLLGGWRSKENSPVSFCRSHPPSLVNTPARVFADSSSVP